MNIHIRVLTRAPRIYNLLFGDIFLYDTIDTIELDANSIERTLGAQYFYQLPPELRNIVAKHVTEPVCSNTRILFSTRHLVDGTQSISLSVTP